MAAHGHTSVESHRGSVSRSRLDACLVASTALLFLTELRRSSSEEEDVVGRLLGENGTVVRGASLRADYDGVIVFYSILIAILGAYVSLCTASHMKQVRNPAWYWMLVIQTGLGLGWCTVWTMHFVGMGALALHTPDQAPTDRAFADILFEPALTCVSGIAAWVVTAITVHISLGRSKVEERGVIDREAIMRICLSTTLLSSGVCIAHYMGMASQQGHFTMAWNGGVVAASVIIAIVACGAGLCIIVFLPDKNLIRLGASVVIGLAVNSIHWCGMASASYFYSPEMPQWGLGRWAIESKSVLVAVLVIDLVIMGSNTYYVEVIQVRDKKMMEAQLSHENYIQNAKRLIKRSKAMRFPMALLRADTFLRLGRLVPHETLRDQHKLLLLDSPKAAAKVRKSGCIVFFSHQWLSRMVPDPSGSQFGDMALALRQLAQRRRLKIEQVFVWVDYCSIPQLSADQQQLAIDSLPAFASACSAFVIIAPQVLHSETKAPCNFTSYSQRFWCRLEVFCAMLSALRVSSQEQVETIGEMSQEEDEGVTPKTQPSQSMGQMTSTWNSTVDVGGLNEKQRIFLVVEGTLQRLTFFGAKGFLPEYEKLLYVYEGELDCCRRGHVTASGEEVQCDKIRVVETISGCYGAMLSDLQKLRRRRKQLSLSETAAMSMAELIVAQSIRLFPEDVFSSRIEAMHDYISISDNPSDPTGTRSLRVGTKSEQMCEGGEEVNFGVDEPSSSEVGDSSQTDESESLGVAEVERIPTGDVPVVIGASGSGMRRPELSGMRGSAPSTGVAPPLRPFDDRWG